MKSLLFICLLLVMSIASATKVQEMPLADMTAQASDIAIARVVGMVGRTDSGQVVTKGEFRTGPGLGNTVLVNLRIRKVLKGKDLREGMTHEVALWPMWHMATDLGMASRQQLDVIVFLKRSDGGLLPVFAPDPYLPVNLEKDVRALIDGERHPEISSIPLH